MPLALRCSRWTSKAVATAGSACQVKLDSSRAAQSLSRTVISSPLDAAARYSKA